MAYILKDTMSAGLSWLSWVFSAGLLRPLTGTFTHLRLKMHALSLVQRLHHEESGSPRTFPDSLTTIRTFPISKYETLLNYIANTRAPTLSMTSF